MYRSTLTIASAVLIIACAALAGPAAAQDTTPPIEPFLALVTGPPTGHETQLARIDSTWQALSAPMVLETLRMVRDRQLPARLIGLLRRHTGENHGFDVDAWWRWVWSQPIEATPDYARFKGRLYSVVDPRFGHYFRSDRVATARIRLDEIRWGGVRRDGIPPLREPGMVSADEADRWLGEHDRVFGISLHGDTRAYPQRILGYHEMFTDTVGGAPIAGVYCTLCGAMVVYGTRVDSVTHRLGTSGFLFRSNKLMYDAATQSLWSTLWGEPVVGPLADSGIELQRHPVVTTTWKTWRAQHPETKVLSLSTGYDRDYAEGAAYRRYFATDELMFAVPALDRRLRNKDEILGLLHPGTAPLALSHRFLMKNRIHEDALGDLRIAVVTDDGGAHRVYAVGAVGLQRLDDMEALDSEGNRWQVTEEALVFDEQRLPRLPAHRAFWFGWVSAFPSTRLVQ